MLFEIFRISFHKYKAQVLELFFFSKIQKFYCNSSNLLSLEAHFKFDSVRTYFYGSLQWLKLYSQFRAISQKIGETGFSFIFDNDRPKTINVTTKGEGRNFEVHGSHSREGKSLHEELSVRMAKDKFYVLKCNFSKCNTPILAIERVPRDSLIYFILSESFV